MKTNPKHSGHYQEANPPKFKVGDKVLYRLWQGKHDPCVIRCAGRWNDDIDDYTYYVKGEYFAANEAISEDYLTLQP